MNASFIKKESNLGYPEGVFFGIFVASRSQRTAGVQRSVGTREWLSGTQKKHQRLTSQAGFEFLSFVAYFSKLHKKAMMS